jgi:hypothetical protein
MKLIPLLRVVRKTIKGALLHGRDPDPQGSVIKPAHATITGQLFFDDSRVGGAHEGLRQCQSPGLWEVLPMTLLKLDPPG